MGIFIRGAKNAFRNVVRTISVTLILALSIGLALVMLLSYQAVQAKIVAVKDSIGSTVTVSPAGAQGFEGGGEPITDAEVATIKGLPDVSAVSTTLQDRLSAGDTTSLQSAIEAGSLGQRFNRGGRSSSEDTGSTSVQSESARNAPTRTFAPPMMVTGVSNPDGLITSTWKLTSGGLFNSDSDENVALLGTQLATKNNLSVGSTFTAYGATITVKGVYDAGNQFANSGIYMPIKSLQRLSDQAGTVSSVEVTAASSDKVGSVEEAIKTKIGEDKVDVSSSQETIDEVVSPLENIKTISLYSLIGALVAGAIITLLTMIMIVRERRREIGVLKAIGASNLGVMGQFVSESLVLTFMGGVVGIIAGIAFSNPVLDALVSNSSNTAGTATRMGGGPATFTRGAVRLGNQFGGGIQNAVHDLHANIGIDILLYGVGAALLIAIVGSALPAWLIAKVKPAEVMRAE